MGKKKAPKKSPVPTEEADVDSEKLQPTGAVCNYAPPNYDDNERNVKIQRLDINYHGHHVLQETKLELVQGRRYGLVGPNGCGKSTLMNVLGKGELKLPPKLDYFHLSHEVPATDESAIDCVMKVDTERSRLEQEIEDLQGKEEDEGVGDRLDLIYERLDELEAETAEARASRILFGLGFDAAMQARPCKSYSGGWRMRIALAQVLFLRPSLMLLDEPTNHLDIEAVVWLEHYLCRFKGILFMVSHSQDFMNSICTNIVSMRAGKLNYYAGNYDQFCITLEEREEHQAKRRAWEQGQIKSMRDYIARFGHGSKKLARQAQSKEKTLAKMVRKGLTDAVHTNANVSFMFPDAGYLPPPVIKFENVYFKYPTQENYLYEEVEFGIDLDSHVCLVGPNGAGKTTLQKLITGELEPTKGYVSKNGHCTVARFNQHFVDQLDMDLTPLQYMRKEYPEIKEPETMRAWIGRFGITGSSQTSAISTLSDGLKSRVVLAWMAQRAPHVLLLDEPTNHLDMDSIDALAEALNDFEGAVILVSHDMRLIAQVASEIWICDNNRVTKFNGNIADYKDLIEARVAEAQEKLQEKKKPSHEDPTKQVVKKKEASPKAVNKPSKPAGKPAGKKSKGPGKVLSLSKPEKKISLKPPQHGEELVVEIKKEPGVGIGIGLDAFEHDDELVLVLDGVNPNSIADKKGLAPLVGCRIAKYNNSAILTEDDAGEMAQNSKASAAFTLTFTALPEED